MTAALNADKLGKLLALASSDNDSEALAALRKAKGMLAAAGSDFVSLAGTIGQPAPKPAVQTGHATQADAARAAGFRVFNLDDPADLAEYQRQERQRREARWASTIPERDAVIARYGSDDAAQAPTERERLLADATAPLIRTERRTFSNGMFTVSTLDGWNGDGDLPESVRAAVAGAYPLPSSVAEALAEHLWWEARWHDLDLVVGGGCQDFSFGHAVEARRRVLEELIERDEALPARSAADIRARLQYIADAEFNLGPEMLRGVLVAFDRVLIEGQAEPRPHDDGTEVGIPHHARASDRRAHVLDLLKNVETASWSDRAIAKAAGVSPTTVGNLRRQVRGAA